MSWAALKVQKSQKFGDLKVMQLDNRPEWVLCICWCGDTRAVHQDNLLNGRITACIGCMARMKMERSTNQG